MNTCYEEERRVLHILREAHVRVGEEWAVYRLFENCFATSQYYVEILYGKERAAACVSDDASAASSFFDAVVRGTVTPCTLSAIVEDFR